MRPRTILKTSLALGIATSFLSCSLRINEPELERRQINVKVAGQDCLGDIGETISRYTEGKSNAAEIDGFFSCLTSGMHAFMEKTTSADPRRYQPRELAGFLSKYFLSNRPIPDGLLHQLMALKKGIFGGERHTISRDEIHRILSLFDSFAKVAKSLHPYMPLTPERLLGESTTEVELLRTMAAIETASVELGKTLQGSLGTYPIAGFSDLLAELKSFSRANGWGIGWVESLERWPAHFPAVKSVLVSPPGHELRQEDWPRLFYLIPRTYALYLRYKLHFKKPKSFLEGDGLVQIVKILDESMMLLESAVKPRASQRISGKEIENLLTSLEKLDLLPMPKSELRTLLTLAVNRFIPDPKAGGTLQFSLANLKELRILYSYFTDGLRAMEGAFRQEYGGRFQDILLSRWHTTQLVEKDPFRHTVFNNDSTKVALLDLRENINKVGISFDPASGIVAVPGDGGLLMSHFHLTRMHYIRTFNKILLRAYGNQQAGTMSEKQVLFMFDDLKPVFDLFKFDAASLKGAVGSRLFEAIDTCINIYS